MSEKKKLILFITSLPTDDEYALQSLTTIVGSLQREYSVEVIKAWPDQQNQRSLFVRGRIGLLWSTVKAVRRIANSDVHEVLVYQPTVSLLLISLFFLRNKQVVVDGSAASFLAVPSLLFRNSLLRKLFCLPARIIVSSTQQKQLARALFNLDASRVKVVSKGIPAAMFLRLNAVKYYQKPYGLTLTYSGTLDDPTRIWPLLHAAVRMPGVKLNLIGDGKLFPALRKYIRSNRLRSVSLYNALNWKRKLPFYQTSSALVVFPEKADESRPTDGLMEAASIGLPVVYMGIAANQPLVRRLEHVITVSEFTEESVTAGLRELPQGATERSAANRRLIHQRYLSDRLYVTYRAALVEVPEMSELELSSVSVTDLLDSALTA